MSIMNTSFSAPLARQMAYPKRNKIIETTTHFIIKKLIEKQSYINYIFLTWVPAIFVKKARERFQTPSAFVPTVSEPILIVSGRKLNMFTGTAGGLITFRKILHDQIAALPADCASITAGFLKMEPVFAVCGGCETERSMAEGLTREICIIITIPFPQTAWAILSVPPAPAADIPNMLFQKDLSMVTGIWPYSTMPVDLIAYTVKTTILRNAHFLLKKSPQKILPRPWTTKPIASVILAGIPHLRSSMP
jgi:hypothetical protein